MGAGVLGESPADMRVDDGMAMVFDSDILEEEVEILGYPEFEVEFTCDKPNAFMYAQLSDIHRMELQQSFLWTYESDALEGHDKVVYLERR